MRRCACMIGFVAENGIHKGLWESESTDPFFTAFHIQIRMCFHLPPSAPGDENMNWTKNGK